MRNRHLVKKFNRSNNKKARISVENKVEDSCKDEKIGSPG